MFGIESRLPAAFNRLAWSNLAAQSAEQIGLAASPIVAVLALGAGAGETGFLQTMQSLPFLLLSLPAGVLADRTSRRRLMVIAESVRAASLLAILLLAALHLLTLPLLAALGFVGAAGTVAYGVSAPSIVPALVRHDQLAAANGRLELMRTAAFTGGPALGGALVGWVGAPPAFAVAAALSLCAVAFFAGLREPARPKLPPRHVLHDLREGAGFVFRHPLLRPTLLAAVVFNSSLFVMMAVYAPYAVHHIGLNATQIGLTLATQGVGMIVGALAAAPLARVLRFGAVIALGPCSGAAALLCMTLTIWLPSFALAMAAFFFLGAGPILWMIGTATLRQSVTPGALLGRVSATVITATQGSRPIGALIGATVGGAYGAEACILVACAGFLVQVAIIFASPVPRLARQPEPVSAS
jgi:predicted MFS family arabinose efflux permease